MFPDFLVYNRGVFEQIGIEDPKELYDKGEWTWDTMTDCIRKFIDSDADGNRTGLYGATAYSAQSFINSTGTALISVGADGKLVQNFKTAQMLTRAVTLCRRLKRRSCIVPGRCHRC